mgnify:CR=1 FL=1
MDPMQNRWGYANQAQSGAIFDEGLRQHMLRVYNYMGLGLVISRDIVAAFNGELDLRPSDTGAVFVVTLRQA